MATNRDNPACSAALHQCERSRREIVMDGGAVRYWAFRLVWWGAAFGVGVLLHALFDLVTKGGV